MITKHYAGIAIWLVLACLSVHGQDKSTCAQYGYDSNGQLTSHDIPCSSVPQWLPDNPTPQPERRITVWSLRKWTEPALRNPFKSKTFNLAFITYGLTDFADGAITHHRAGRTIRASGIECFESNGDLSPKPRNGELWAAGGIEFGAMLGLGWLSARYEWLPIAWGQATYGTVIHARGAYAWKDCH